MRRFDLATSTRSPSSKASAWRSSAAAETGVELVIVRPSGIYGPGDRRLLKLFRGVARRRFVILGRGEIFYHLTHVDDLVAGFRLAGTVPAAAGRTYILAGAEVTTLAELVRIIAEQARRARRPAGICRCGRSGLPARPARRCARRSASSRRCTGGASTSSPRAGRSTSRARGPNWALRPPWASPMAWAARWPGTGRQVGCDGRADPARAGRAVRRHGVVARQVLAADRRSARDARARQIRGRAAHLAVGAGALGLALRKTLYRSCSARAAAASSSARTSCCAIRTRSGSATTS